MTRVADSLLEPSWDIVQEPEGFSAEATVEHELGPDEAERLEERVRGLAPTAHDVGTLRVRGTVSVDDRTLWAHANVIGPGVFDDDARRAALRMLEQLWSTIQAL